MYLLILLTLILYVLSYRRLVTMFAHRTCKISIRPELPSPQLLLHLRTAPENLLGRDAFEYRDNLRNTVSGH